MFDLEAHLSFFKVVKQTHGVVSLDLRLLYVAGPWRMLFEKYKKFWETGDIEAFTSIIDPEIEIIMHSTGGVIDPDLWLERITAVVLSDAYAENIRCHC